MPEKLYTIIFERSDGKDTVLKQLPGRDSSDVLGSWIHLLSKQSSMSQREREDLLEELEYMEAVPLTGLLNAWCRSMSLKEKFYLTNIVRTDTAPTESLALRVSLPTSPQLESAYEYYRSEYLKLKSCDIRNNKIHVARRRADKWMRYWDIKTQFMSRYNVLKSDKSPQSLYTFVFEYGGGTYIIQLWLSVPYLDFILVAWVEKMLQEVDGSEKSRKLIDNEADRLLLMERAMDERYYPEPISGLVNVWGTYFTLSKGLGNLTIIKTCPH